MKKVFISQPMKGRSAEEITAEREYIIVRLEKEFGEIEILESYFPEWCDWRYSILARSQQNQGLRAVNK